MSRSRLLNLDTQGGGIEETSKQDGLVKSKFFWRQTLDIAALLSVPSRCPTQSTKNLFLNAKPKSFDRRCDAMGETQLS
jgi:hypothetical protein